jgi:putative phosphotransacetylase
MENLKLVPVGISGRHVHVTQEVLEILFGESYQLTKMKDLSQPGQYAAEEKVDVVSPAGLVLAGVRILGPVRKFNQVELSQTDARKFKFNAPVRSSGDVKGSGASKLVGPKGSVELTEGVIIADRHIHFSDVEAKEFNVVDGEKVCVKIYGEKPGVLENVLVRVSPQFRLDCHLDTDDGSAFLLETGSKAGVFKSYKID